MAERRTRSGTRPGGGWSTWPTAALLVVALATLGVTACGSTNQVTDAPAAGAGTGQVTASTGAGTGTDRDGAGGGATTSITGAADDEEAVRQVHTRFMTELFTVDERADGPEAFLPLVEELTTGAQRRRLEERAQDHLDSGERSVDLGYESNIVEVVLDGDHALVADCSLDTESLYSADGELLSGPDEDHLLRQTALTVIDGAWKVEDFFTGGEILCDP